MNPALTEALKEAYAMASVTTVIHRTIELTHSNIDGQLRFVAGYENLEANLEASSGGALVTFEAGAFDIELPASGDKGAQELNITVDNTDLRVSEFCRMASNFDTPVIILYREYTSDNLTAPANDPPLLLFLRRVKINDSSISGKASFADIINMKFPSQLYTRTRFPGLAS